MTRLAITVLLGATALALVVWMLVRGTTDTAIGTAADPADAALPSSPASARATKPEQSTRPLISPRRVQGLEVEAMWSDGAPASRATVAVIGSGEVLPERAETDDHGIARFDGGDGPATLGIFIHGAPATIARIPVSAGRHRVTVERGVSVTGRVEVDGKPPTRPMELWLSASEHERRIPDDFYRLQDVGFVPKCFTDPGGRFRFTGLKPGSEWGFGTNARLARVLSMAACDGEDLVWVPAPATDVLVRMARYPVISGRVVVGADHQPVPKALVWYPLSRGGQGGASHSLTCDERGGFQVPVRVEDEHEMILKAYYPGGVGERVVRLSPVPASDQDLGDIELPAARFISFVVRDERGAPIPDALASVRNKVRESSRTDRQGRGRLQVGAEMRSFRVGALRFGVEDVPVPPDDKVVEITLHASATVEIVVTTADGSPPTGVGVRLFGNVRDRTPFNRPDLIYEELGAARYGGGGSNEEYYRLDAHGRALIAGINSGDFVVKAVGSEERILASKSIRLTDGASERVELEIDAPMVTVRGLVTDDAGMPITDAQVFLTTKSPEALTRSGGFLTSGAFAAYSDVAGRFELKHLGRETLNLVATKHGFIPFSRLALPVPSDGSDVRVVLRRGRELDVVVVFEDGRPVRRLGDVHATCSGVLTVPAREKRPGVYRLIGLPEGPVGVSLSFPRQRTWQQTVDPAKVGEIRFVIPTPGTIKVNWTLPDAIAPPCRVRLRSQSNDEVRLLAPTTPAEARSGVMTFEDLLPGDYTLEIQTIDGTRSVVIEPRPVKVVSGQTAEVSLRK